MEGLDDVLQLIYGNHPKSKKLHAEAVRIINHIREKNEISREDLAIFLSVDLNSQNGKKHFYNLVSPMFGKILVSEHRGKAVFYHLSYDMFRVYMDGIRRRAKYYLLRSAEAEKEDQEDQ